jgi:uncharacterized membrane protein
VDSSWTVVVPAVGAAFAASLVEAVEAFTLVLAVGLVRGWRAALTGSIAALGVLAVLILCAGPILNRIPLSVLQLAIGASLSLFGLSWLHKAILRYAGVIPMHDEKASFTAETTTLSHNEARRSKLDWVGCVTAFKAVFLEGLEVAFIVLAVGAGRGLIIPASLGALAACILVLAVGIVMYRPIARVPENALKFGVGIVLSAFGVFWSGEGLGVEWPGGDLALIALAVGFIFVGLGLATLLRRKVMRAVS